MTTRKVGDVVKLLADGTPGMGSLSGYFLGVHGYKFSEGAPIVEVAVPSGRQWYTVRLPDGYELAITEGDIYE